MSDPNLPDDPKKNSLYIPNELLQTFIAKIYEDSFGKYCKGQKFVFPFFITDDIVESINIEVIDQFGKLDMPNVSFNSVTRFQDLTTVSYSDFDEYLAKAGNKKDPESSSLEWRSFQVTENGSPIAGKVSLFLMTEKKLSIQELAPGDYGHSFIDLEISGTNQDWVEMVFSNLHPYISTTRLNGIYRPLWVFRNKWFIAIAAQMSGFAGMFIGIRSTAFLLTHGQRERTVHTLEEIKSQPEILLKFNMYLDYILNQKNGPWWIFIFSMLGGILGYVILHFIGLGLLPKLTPNSAIAIGLSNRRSQKALRVFKFIVFTVLVSGFIIPVILHLLLK